MTRRRTRPALERFMGKVSMLPDQPGCWLWMGACAVNGYGHFALDASQPARPILSHRASWLLHNGPIPDGLCVLHKCDVRQCVRPDHLFLGTRTDNMRDASKKARLAYGERHVNTPLTSEQVRQILVSNAPLVRLAEQFSVSARTIDNIKSGRTWKYFPRESIPC